MNMEVFLVEEAEVNPNNSWCKTEECLVNLRQIKTENYLVVPVVCAYFGMFYLLR